MRYYPAVGPAIPQTWAGRSRVPHPFAGDPRGPPDLHVLSTPPAFVLSQDQTLQECLSARSNAVHPLTRSPASGINSCHCPLPAAHERRGSSKASHDLSSRLSINGWPVRPAAPALLGKEKYTAFFSVRKGSALLPSESSCDRCRGRGVLSGRTSIQGLVARV